VPARASRSRALFSFCAVAAARRLLFQCSEEALMKSSLAAVAVSVALTVVTVRARVARACGGCFAPSETITSVDSHRMVISLGLSRTILWDQIRYSGAPEDFVWVLPVPTPEATIAVADPIFFDDLEAGTAPIVSPPPLPPGPSCPPPPDGWGGDGQDAGASFESDAGGVDVYREEVVGPYETVVIGSEDPAALHAWLVDHGYAVPDATLPVIAKYVEQDSKFIVLRLAPDEGVSAMQPVRVQYPGYMASFPLAMVTVGASGTLDLSLWVIAEQRYAAHNYGTVTIDADQLAWNFAAGVSNYDELFAKAIEDAGGAAWVAELAAPLSSVWFEAWAERDIAAEGNRYPYLTRLRTSSLVDHLTEDLLLAPSADASDLSRFLQATIAVNPPPPPTCPDWDGDGEPDTDDDRARDPWGGRRGGGRMFGCAIDGGRGTGLAGVMIVMAVVLARRVRRAIRPRTS
jgi:hypothetical protein